MLGHPRIPNQIQNSKKFGLALETSNGRAKGFSWCVPECGRLADILFWVGIKIGYGGSARFHFGTFQGVKGGARSRRDARAFLIGNAAKYQELVSRKSPTHHDVDSGCPVAVCVKGKNEFDSGRFVMGMVKVIKSKANMPYTPLEIMDVESCLLAT